MSQFSFLKKLFSPQRRRERKDKYFSIACEGQAMDRLDYPPGKVFAEGLSPALAGFKPASHGIEQIMILSAFFAAWR